MSNQWSLNINRYTRGVTLIPCWLFFAGGFPRFRWAPRFVTWGPHLSVFWLGTELVVRFKK